MDCLAGERNICFLGYGRRQKNVFVGLAKFDFSLDRIKWHFAFISRDIQGMKTRKEKMRCDTCAVFLAKSVEIILHHYHQFTIINLAPPNHKETR